MIYYFIPFERVGEFILKSDIRNYQDDFNFTVKAYEDEFSSSEHYSLENPKLSLFVDLHSKKIDEIACYEEVLYKGRNLIGMTIDEFISHTGEKYYGEIDKLDFEDDNIPQYVYEFDDIGLQVWTKNNIVITVIASQLSEE